MFRHIKFKSCSNTESSIPCLFRYIPGRFGTMPHFEKVKKFFEDAEVTVIDWPGNSSDMNPIENLWSICKNKLRTIDYSTKEKMIFAVIHL